MRSALILILGLLSILATTADATSLRVVHVMPVAAGRAAPVLDLYVDGFPLVSRINYAQMVSIAQIPAGLRTFSVRSADTGQVLAERSLSFNAAAPMGHYIALAGDGSRQPHELIAWQRAQAPLGGSAQVGVSASPIHLAPGLSPVTEYMQSHGRAGEIGGASGLFEFEYGVPLWRGLSGGTPGPMIWQIAVIDPTHGLFAWRSPAFESGIRDFDYFLIGNGSQRTPFEWLVIEGAQIFARGRGSYAESPVLAGKQYYANAAKPGTGLFLETLDEGARVVGFAFGIGSDLGSTWQLLDGPRMPDGGYQLASQTAAPEGDIGERWQLRFASCKDAEVTRYRGHAIVESLQVSRGGEVSNCVEFQHP